MLKEESHHKGMHAKDCKYLRAQYRQNWSPVFTKEETGLSFLRAKGINVERSGGGSVTWTWGTRNRSVSYWIRLWVYLCEGNELSIQKPKCLFIHISKQQCHSNHCNFFLRT